MPSIFSDRPDPQVEPEEYLSFGICSAVAGPIVFGLLPVPVEPCQNVESAF